MLLQLLGRNPRSRIIDALYGAIVAQARRPAFYRWYGVPDTVEGRFDMIVLHVVLFFRRVRADNAARPLGQAVFDRFCRELDAHLRETGVGDLAVPRRMRVLAEAFYGRARSYEAALAAPDADALVAALAKNVFASAGPDGARRLAAYVHATEDALAAQDAAAFTGAALEFPDPDTILVPNAFSV